MLHCTASVVTWFFAFFLKCLSGIFPKSFSNNTLIYLPSAFQRNEMQNYTFLGTSRKCCFSVNHFFCLSTALQHLFEQLEDAGFLTPPDRPHQTCPQNKHQNSRNIPVWNQTQFIIGQKKEIHWTTEVPFLADKCWCRHIGATATVPAGARWGEPRCAPRAH